MDNYGEKLASLDTSVQFIKEMVVDIKNDLKSLPKRDEFNDLEDRVTDVEKTAKSTAIRVGIVSGIIGAVAGFFTKYLN